MKKTIFASLIGLSVMLFSCSKKNPVDQENQTTKELQTKVLGKWVFNNASFKKSSASSRANNGLQKKGAILGLKTVLSRSSTPITTSETPATPNTNAGFVEFMSNNTYIIYDSEGNFFTGTFEVKDGSSISLAGFGSISEIKFTQQRIDFKIFYSATGKTVSITANKAADVASTDKTKLLCAHTWYVTDEEDGAEDVLNQTFEVYDNDGNVIGEISPDKATVLFSISGTYVIQFFKDTKLVMAKTSNWKWHSTDPNKLAYWSYDEEIDEENDTVIIRELTKDILKTQEKWGSGNDTEYSNLVLKPVI